MTLETTLMIRQAFLRAVSPLPDSSVSIGNQISEFNESDSVYRGITVEGLFGKSVNKIDV